MTRPHGLCAGLGIATLAACTPPPIVVATSPATPATSPCEREADTWQCEIAIKGDYLLVDNAIGWEVIPDEGKRKTQWRRIQVPLAGLTLADHGWITVNIDYDRSPPRQGGQVELVARVNGRGPAYPERVGVNAMRRLAISVPADGKLTTLEIVLLADVAEPPPPRSEPLSKALAATTARTGTRTAAITWLRVHRLEVICDRSVCRPK